MHKHKYHADKLETSSFTDKLRDRMIHYCIFIIQAQAKDAHGGNVLTTMSAR